MCLPWLPWKCHKRDVDEMLVNMLEDKKCAKRVGFGVSYLQDLLSFIFML